ncbi:hypothetical protein C7974DRAFT_119410 [Boeremia exigua]|uniref:uncharacterized protein n=1 Tax=Boeremia exigua TaxID=749465 RepID=UPI001E8D326C|nr:uncharacterized protein C7974DRAFT_119410 [Boeremia exigua]KAH6643199.1 hypothetical protein C7974DRAFT_119410 [Boeremia exigua]
MKGTESTERPRKRSRTSEDADDAAVTSGGKKTRGRPRVDTQDATAADRRRTQIRLAQRAYRQRKETTISALQRQSTQLRVIIEEMNKTFLRYNDSIVQSGLLQLNPGLAKDAKEMTETFASLVKSSNERTLDSDEEEFAGEDASAQQAQVDPASNPTTRAQPLTTPTEEEQSWSHSAASEITEQAQPKVAATQPGSYLAHISSSSYSLPEPNNRSGLVRRYRDPLDEALEQSRPLSALHQFQAARDPPRTQQQQQELLPKQPLPFGLVDIPSREQSPFLPPYIFPVNVPAIGAELPPPPRQKPLFPSATSITKTLSPSYTYSYEEVTFARRLTRATLESGFLLLSTPDIHPALLNYIFKLSLPYLSLEETRNRFKTILARGVDEDLDWYATPFLHLGGAGTHYQRRDAEGMPIPMKNTWTIRQMGPVDRRMIRVESVADGRTQDLEGIDLHGFEGEWFDSYDVQGYIEEQWHCRIDPRSSFAECLIDSDSTSPSENETGSPSLSRGSTASNSDNPTPPPLPASFFEPPYGLDMFFNRAPTPDLLSATPKNSLQDLSFDQTLGLDLAPAFDLGFVGSSGYSTFGLDMMGEAEQLPVVKQRPKKVAWVDVQKLIDKMTKRAVCLGRAPGYRRKDVDTAFREALIPAC